MSWIYFYYVTSRVVWLTKNRIKLYLSHAPNTTGVDCEMLTYKPLTNSAVQEELKKDLPSRPNKNVLDVRRLGPSDVLDRSHYSL